MSSAVRSENEDPVDKAATLAALRAQVRRLEGCLTGTIHPLGVSELDGWLPGGGLALGCIHEVGGAGAGDDGAAVGFAAVVLGRLATDGGRVLWLTRRDDLYPPGLAGLGLRPERLIPVPVRRDRDTLWAMEEALRHRRLAAVLGEVNDLDLVASRRLQLAAEGGGVTGLLLRPPASPPAARAAVTRWRLAATASIGISGLGPPRWRVELLRCRGGRPGQWVLEWTGDRLRGSPDADADQSKKLECPTQSSSTTRLRPVALAS